jgi:hypothetical protein
VALDSRGVAHVVGSTFSERFPVTLRAFQRESPDRRDFCFLRYCFEVFPPLSGIDAVVFRVNTNGILLYSSYLGGKDPETAQEVAVDASFGTVVVGGTESENFPLVDAFRTAHRGDSEAFLAVVSAQGSTLTYSTFLGGDGDEAAAGVAMRGDDAYVVGSTDSPDLATRATSAGGGFQDFLGGGVDGFVARVNTAGSGDASLLYSSYLGGRATDRAQAVAVDAQGSAYVTGVTGSLDFPLVAPPGRPLLDGSNDVDEAFLTRVGPTGSGLQLSTFLGGSQEDEGIDVVVDDARMVYVLGATTSPDFAILNAFQPDLAGDADLFVAKVDPFQSRLLWSSFLGGSGAEGDVLGNQDVGLALDGVRRLVVAGATTATDFPVEDAFEPDHPGDVINSFVTQIGSSAPATIGVFRPGEGSFFLRNRNSTGVADFTVFFGGQGDLPIAGDWNGFGFDKPGVFSAGTFLLRPFGNAVNHPYLCCAIAFAFGQPGDLPLAGDWDGDGVDTVGIFRNGLFELRNSNSAGPADLSFGFGVAGDVPVAGDWDGDGDDDVGLFRPSAGQFFLDVGNDGGIADVTVAFGQPGDLPVAADWDGDGVDTVGVLRGSNALLRNSNSSGPANLDFFFGVAGDLPVAGDWDGRP